MKKPICHPASSRSIIKGYYTALLLLLTAGCTFLFATSINTVQTITDDVTKTADACLHGVPSDWLWACPNGSMNDSVGSGMKGFSTKGSLYVAAEGSSAVNTRVQIRNMTLYVLSKKDNKWHLVKFSESVNGSSYAENYSGASKASDVRYEQLANGGGSSVLLSSGFNYVYSPWGYATEIDPADQIGVCGWVQARLTVDNPALPDDRASAKYILNFGGTWQVDVWSGNNSRGAATGRMKYVKSQWQCFNFSTVRGALLAANPPPMDQDADSSLYKWNNRDIDSTLPPGCQHVRYNTPYLSGQYASMGDYNIYLPPNYATETARYPVLYHLHSVNSTEYTDLPAAYVLDSLIRAGKIQPMIEVWCKTTLAGWYTDHGTGDDEESYFIKGLIPHIDSLYRTNGTRGLSGFSMGGAGALYYAFKYARQPLFRGCVDFDGAFDSTTYPLAPNLFKLAADSAANIRNAKMMIRSWAEVQENGGSFYKSHQKLDTILKTNSIPYQYSELISGHVGVWGEFSIDKTKPRKISNPTRIIEGYLKLDSTFAIYRNTGVSSSAGRGAVLHAPKSLSTRLNPTLSGIEIVGTNPTGTRLRFNLTGQRIGQPKAVAKIR